MPDSPKIHAEILSLLDKTTGEPYNRAAINAIEKDGLERYKYDVPPGFEDSKDKSEQGYRTYGDFSYQKLFEDLKVWKQMINKAKNEGNPTSIIFITEEKKKYWWETEVLKLKDHYLA